MLNNRIRHYLRLQVLDEVLQGRLKCNNHVQQTHSVISPCEDDTAQLITTDLFLLVIFTAKEAYKIMHLQRFTFSHSEVKIVLTASKTSSTGFPPSI